MLHDQESIPTRTDIDTVCISYLNFSYPLSCWWTGNRLTDSTKQGSGTARTRTRRLDPYLLVGGIVTDDKLQSIRKEKKLKTFYQNQNAVGIY